MPKVSVIIPVYNVEKYLRECLDSVINQTLQDIEIICVNDGSTDGSPDILEEYANKDQRIKIINQENQGLGGARNTGMKYITSSYTYFLDSDDYIELNALEKLYKKAKQYNLDICVCNVRNVDIITKATRVQDGAINLKYLPTQDVFSSNDVNTTIFHLFIGWVWDKLYRSSLILDNNISFPPFRNTEDTAFTYMALILSKRISTIQECLINHRVNISTSMSVNRENEPDAFIKAMELLKNNLLNKNLYNDFEISYINYFVTFANWHVETITDKFKETIYKKIKEYLKTLNIEQHPENIFIEEYYKKLYILFKEHDSYKNFYNAKCIIDLNYKFIEKIFSIKNTSDKKYKIICICGIKLKIRRR